MLRLEDPQGLAGSRIGHNRPASARHLAIALALAVACSQAGANELPPSAANSLLPASESATGGAAGGSATPAAENETPAADEELTVTAERLPLTFAERQDIYGELAKARELYRRNQIKDALPYLERTAKSGFKDSQAKMGHILLQGLGDVERDSLTAVGWLGAASSGRTSPTIRNYFNDIWQRIPDRHVPVFEEVVQEYTARYGAHATGVVCAMRRRAGTHLKSLECFFEADVEEDVRRGVEAHRARGEAEQRARELRENWRIECYGPGGTINPQCAP